MSSDIAIRINNLGKCFQIYDSPRDRLKQFVLPTITKMIGVKSKDYFREFWALQRISLDVKKGEAIGIVGCNGSGKSTLLQLICGTLTPTTGNIKTYGRVAALLELGSGFNPEFTGRENVYLNAAILGLKKNEIDCRFDKIISFAEIGDFIDQPVKTYSSGMFLRLAFAVVVHVDPDILIVDEALAVGDAKFQLKCFRKMDEIKETGTTILFVTHDTSMVKSFCSRAIFLNRGIKLSDGDPKDVVMDYFNMLFPKDSLDAKENMIESDSSQENITADSDNLKEVTVDVKNLKQSFGLGGAVVEKVKIQGVDYSFIIIGGQELKISVKYKWQYNIVKSLARENNVKENLIMGISLSDNKGSYLFGFTTYDKGIFVDLKGSEDTVEFSFVMPHMVDGKYFLNAAFALGTQESHVQLCWYDGLIELNLERQKKYIYGIFYNEYRACILNGNH